MKKIIFLSLLCLFVIGCQNPEEIRLDQIRKVDHQVNPQYNEFTQKYEFASSDILLKTIGEPDVKYTYNEWVRFIEKNDMMDDSNKQDDIDIVKWHIERAREYGMNIKDDSDVNVWVYMPNHNVKVCFGRFLLPPIVINKFARPYFLIYNNCVICGSNYTEMEDKKCN